MDPPSVLTYISAEPGTPLTGSSRDLCYIFLRALPITSHITLTVIKYHSVPSFGYKFVDQL